MEFFEGTRIDRFCNQNRLSVKARLQLFVSVCNAVQHAHQKGIIHRDLKPSNILARVELDDFHTKVIDFGLAKAVDDKAMTGGAATAFGQVLGTYQYMSPEQANSDSARIDSRTDIYSLGALLYELLCGQPVFHGMILSETPIQEAIQVISESVPLRPSQRIAQRDLDPAFVDAHRSNRNALQNMLFGDLDWIVMKAIEKEPGRRYQTASEFGADVQRFLDNDPVLARPPSTKYRIGKFVSKNLFGVAAASLIFTSIAAGTVATSIGWSRALAAEKLAQQRLRESEIARNAEAEARLAETKRAESEKVAKEHAEQLLETDRRLHKVLQGIFNDLNPRVNDPDVPIERQLASRIVEAGTLIVKNDYDRPKYQLQLISELAGALISLGYPQEAVELLRRSAEIVDSNVDDDRRGWIAYTAADLGNALLADGKPKEAAELFRQSLDLYTRISGAKHKNALSAAHRLATAELLQGQIDSAIKRLELVVPMREELFGRDHRITLISKNVLATAYGRRNQIDKAIQLTNQVYSARRSELGVDAIGTVITLSNLADLYFKIGNHEKALEMQSSAHELFMSKLGEQHPNTLAVQTKLAMILADIGSIEDAQRLVNSAIPLLDQRLGEAHPRTLTAQVLRAKLLLRSNQTEKRLLSYSLSTSSPLKNTGNQALTLSMLAPH